MSSIDLTVVTVAYSDKWRVDLHRALADRLNDDEIGWRVVRNLPAHPADEWTGDEPYEVVDGAEPSPDWADATNARSHHHAAGLAAGLAGVTTRYVAIVDADFFVLGPDWYRTVVDHMEEEGVTFFGAPYHPRTAWKARYVPCAVCLFVDRAAVDPGTLDWRPGTLPSAREQPVGPVLGRLFRSLDCEWRRKIGGSLDTGFTIYEGYAAAGGRVECLTPVLTVDQVRDDHVRPRQLALEAFLPDRYCSIPRRRGYFTDVPFAQLGLPDTHALQCEEFWWNERPFGLHLRGAPDEFASDRAAVEAVLDRHAEACA